MTRSINRTLTTEATSGNGLMLKDATVCEGAVTIGGAANVTAAIGARTIDVTDSVRETDRAPDEASTVWIGSTSHAPENARIARHSPGRGISPCRDSTAEMSA